MEAVPGRWAHHGKYERNAHVSNTHPFHTYLMSSVLLPLIVQSSCLNSLDKYSPEDSITIRAIVSSKYADDDDDDDDGGGGDDDGVVGVVVVVVVVAVVVVVVVVVVMMKMIMIN